MNVSAEMLKQAVGSVQMLKLQWQRLIAPTTGRVQAILVPLQMSRSRTSRHKSLQRSILLWPCRATKWFSELRLYSSSQPVMAVVLRCFYTAHNAGVYYTESIHFFQSTLVQQIFSFFFFSLSVIFGSWNMLRFCSITLWIFRDQFVDVTSALVSSVGMYRVTNSHKQAAKAVPLLQFCLVDFLGTTRYNEELFPSPISLP